MGCGNSKDVDDSAKNKGQNAGRSGNRSKQGVNEGMEDADHGNSTYGKTNEITSYESRVSSRDHKTSNSHMKKRDNKQVVRRDDIKEKGFRRRIRENLRQATAGTDVEELENAIATFKKNKLEDNGDLTDAKERLRYLHLRRDLRDAIMRRHPDILEKAIVGAESSDYRSELSSQCDTARRLLAHLGELDNYRHDILGMDQSTISELRSYHHPPSGVYEVMSGTYLLLGYDDDRLKEWTDIQCLLGRSGKESLAREIRKADTINIDEQTSKRVLSTQSKFTLEQIRSVSNGAAAFYVWNQNMCNKSNKDRQQEQQHTSKQATPNTKGRKKNKG